MLEYYSIHAFKSSIKKYYAFAWWNILVHIDILHHSTASSVLIGVKSIKNIVYDIYNCSVDIISGMPQVGKCKLWIVAQLIESTDHVLRAEFIVVYSDVIWRHISGSTFVQVTACCLMAPSYYQKQCWLIISMLLHNSLEGNITANTHESNP